MADPTGLVSLGLGVAKKAVKHGSTVRSRQRHLKALPYAVDMAFVILHNGEQSDDLVTRAAHQQVLIPCISEAEQFLRRVEGRNLFASTINKVWSASDDDKDLKRLLAALDGAPGRIDARILELRISLTQTQQRTNHNELIVLFAKQQSDIQSIHADVARCLRSTIIYGSFFG
ncbi:hypothetical protein EXIGLDRAFT_746588 [Exidia glandulosa HHB12029]|uniref:Uncharacterized protein n=1 Tax=Exidia glandulosa HHB12029 TaxID=1314781 RepID=A0A165LX22_EXIGL|nr:hypothetical protein EXIGLDRAFT_746588 [Exidia glandulosa HHB12029]